MFRILWRIYTKQMDAEDLGRKLLLTPPTPANLGKALKSRMWVL